MWLAVIGIVCVGMSIGVSFGLASAFGVFYGPVHSTLPFLLLGMLVHESFLKYAMLCFTAQTAVTIVYIYPQSMIVHVYYGSFRPWISSIHFDLNFICKVFFKIKKVNKLMNENK